ncbi:class I SAM-dependent methyltransferase [Rhodovibrionaceae bacterium A322]
MTLYPPRRHMDVLDELVSVANLHVLDIGCGDGALVRALTKRQAICVGVEVTPERIAQAEARDKVAAETYMQASGSSLPLPDESMDLVVFFNSLHHLPIDEMAQALEESHRLLKPHGHLYIAEPIAEGPLHAITSPIDDETEVRRLAYEALQAAGDGTKLRHLQEVTYKSPAYYKDFADFRTKMVDVDPTRRSLFQAQEESLLETFERLGQPGERGMAFDNPMRVNLLQRVD